MFERPVIVNTTKWKSNFLFKKKGELYVAFKAKKHLFVLNTYSQFSLLYQENLHLRMKRSELEEYFGVTSYDKGKNTLSPS